MEKPFIIFDFDGTIADTRDLIIEIGNIYASETGAEPIRDADVETYYNEGARALMAKRKFSLFDLAKLLKRGSEIFAEKSDSISLVPGIARAIAELDEKGIMMAVITSNTEKSVKKIMGDLSGSMSGIFPEKDLFGKAAKIKKVLKSLKVNPDSVFYVGDEPRDMLAAARAGVHPIGVTWGFGSKQSLVSAGAERVAGSPNELSLFFSV